jgi:outer membrane receptor protein involved in Fe transport
LRTRLSIALILAHALVRTVPAGAQEAPRPQADTPRFESSVEVQAVLTSEPPPSTVATRMPTLAQDLPLSVATVGRPLLDEQGALVLGDALENVSGVNVATGFGVFDFFVVRGFDSLTGGLVLTDGLPEPESTFYPMYNVRQVEVLKGPGSFLLGGNPLAGAVQLDRKQPQAKTFANAVVGYGRYDTFETSLDANAATADWPPASTPPGRAPRHTGISRVARQRASTPRSPGGRTRRRGSSSTTSSCGATGPPTPGSRSSGSPARTSHPCRARAPTRRRTTPPPRT